MEVLRYNDLDTAGLAEAIHRVEAFLRSGDFRAADVKKLIGTRYYRARLNEADRLLFTFARHRNKTIVLLLEVIRRHAYDRSRFLNGAPVDENKIESVTEVEATAGETAPPLVYVNPNLRHFHLLDKILSFDDLQNAIFHLPPPLIIIGSAGSGKTALTLEKLKQLEGEILYVTLSPYLAECARNLYFANGYENERQSVDFLCFRELLESVKVPSGRPVNFRAFAGWFARHRLNGPIRDAHMLFEEIHGVLTGWDVDAPRLTLEQYQDLGIRQSIFLGEERAAVYSLFEKYLTFLREAALYNPNMVAQEYLARIQPSYDFVVADETQDLTNVQVLLALKTLRDPDHFVLCGDANQIVHPNFFAWSHVKSLFYESREKGRAEIIRVLNANYRNSVCVTDLANRLLLVKNARFGSIDRESNYLVRAVSDREGGVEFLPDNEKTRTELDRGTARSVRTAVIVLREEDKLEARRSFRTPLIFSIQEAKGLEYEAVILLNFVSAQPRAYEAIVEGVIPADLQKNELEYARARDKGDKSLDAYKFYINALYVGLTRAVQTVYWVEKNPIHRLFDLLKLTLQRDAFQVKTDVSSAEEWKEEARKLELQGKQEQAEDIRRHILAQKEVPWQVLTPGSLAALEKEALDPERFNRQAKLLLFDYAATHQVPHLLNALADLRFHPALTAFDHIPSIENKYYAEYRTKQHIEVKRKTDLYGVDFRNPLNQTPLMIAAYLGLDELARWLIHNGANPNLTDNWGRTPLQIALRQAYHSPEYARDRIGLMYPVLLPSCVKLKTDERLVKIDAHRMEFFLINSMVATLQDIFRVKIQHSVPAFQTGDFVHALTHFPDHVIPAHRKNRRALTACMAKHEVDRQDPYNRRFFVRVRHGYYILNPVLEIEIQEQWFNVYDLIHIRELAMEKHDPNLEMASKFILEWRRRGPPPPRRTESEIPDTAGGKPSE